MSNVSITPKHELIQALAGIKGVAEWGMLDSDPGMNAAIADNARLFLWALENSGTQEGDMVDAQQFVNDILAQYRPEGGAK